MEYSNILRNAWRLTWRHKALWFFGFFLALTTASSPFWLYSWNEDQAPPWRYEWDGFDDPTITPAELRAEVDELVEAFRADVPADVRELVLEIVVVVAAAVLVWALVSALLRYVSETATIGLVQEQQETGRMGGVRHGLSRGWSAGAWRLFLIDLILRLPLTLVTLLWLGLSATPLLIWYAGDEALTVPTLALATILFLIGALVMPFLAAFVALLTQLARRACLVEDLGAWPAVKRALGVIRARPGPALVVGLLALAAAFIWGAIAIPLFVLIFPVSITTILVGGLVVALPTALAAVIAESLAAGPLAFVIIGLLALPVFLLIALAPMFFLGGLVRVFVSNLWTLAYRQMIDLPLREPAPKVAPISAAGSAASD